MVFYVFTQKHELTKMRLMLTNVSEDAQTTVGEWIDDLTDKAEARILARKAAKAAEVMTPEDAMELIEEISNELVPDNEIED